MVRFINEGIVRRCSKIKKDEFIKNKQLEKAFVIVIKEKGGKEIKK